jgi:two-component system NarL family sensor kinase
MPETQVVYGIIIVTIFLLLLVGFILFVIFLSRKKQQQLLHENIFIKQQYEQALLQSQLEIQEQTLKTISAEIHDNIGQVLSLVTIHLNTIISSQPADNKLLHTKDLVKKAINDLRNLSKTINSDWIIKEGLFNAIQNELQELEKTGLFTTRFNYDTSYDFSNEQTLMLYRMIQEIINNTIKHSKANQLDVCVSEENSFINIELKDNGIGFLPHEIKSNGVGLFNLENRTKLIGGNLKIVSAPQKGTSIIISIKKMYEDSSISR